MRYKALKTYFILLLILTVAVSFGGKEKKYKYHKVLFGETAYHIARQNGITPQQLQQLNGLKNYIVIEGQTLIVGIVGTAISNRGTANKNIDLTKPAVSNIKIIDSVKNSNIVKDSVKKDTARITNFMTDYPKTIETDISIVDKFNKWLNNSQYLELFLIICVVYFFFNIIILFSLLMIFRRRYRKHQSISDELKNVYGDILSKYLFEENYQLDETKLRKEFKSGFYKDAFLNLLLELHSNLKGEAHDKLQQLYYKLNFENYSLKKSKSFYWHIKAKGFRELAQMEVMDAIPIIRKHINSSNLLLQIEAELALTKLEKTTPLSFLDDIKVELTEWAQINMLNVIKYHRIEIKSFTKWLNSKNESIVIFAVRLIEAFKHYDASEELINILYHVSAKVRKEVIAACGKLELNNANSILISIFDKENDENKLEILTALINLNNAENKDFLYQQIINKENDYKIRTLAHTALNKLGSTAQELIKLLEEQTIDEELKILIKT